MNTANCENCESGGRKWPFALCSEGARLGRGGGEPKQIFELTKYSAFNKKLTTEVPLKSPVKHAPPAFMSDISPKLHSWHRNLFRILRHVVGKSKRPAEAFPCSCSCLQPTGDWIKDAQKGEEMSSTNAFKCSPHCLKARWCSSVAQKINTWPRHVFGECLGPMQWLE